MTLALKAAGIFAVLFALDYVYAIYTKSIVAKRPALAAHMAAVIYMLTGVATLGYTNEPLLLIPAIAGAWLGTYMAARR